MGDQGQLRFMRTADGLAHHDALRKKLLAVRIERLTFLDDHALLTDKAGADADWRTGGTRYVELEGGAHWTKTKSFPASLTKGTTVRVEVEIAADPPDADAVEATIVGKPSGGTSSKPEDSLAFEGSFTLGGGGGAVVKVTLTAKGPLADEVFDCPSRTFTWEVKVGKRSFDLGTTGPHHLYVTYDRPIPGGQPMPTPFGSEPAPLEDGITDKRMEAAVTLTEKMWRQAIEIDDPDTGKKMDRNDPHVLARILNATIPGYTLSPDPTVPAEFGHAHYFNNQPEMARTGAWPIHQYKEQRAECQAIVRYVRGTLLQIGCPGDVRLVVVYAHANVDGGATALVDSVLPPDMDVAKYRPDPETQKMYLSAGLHRDATRIGVFDGQLAFQRLSLADREVKVGELVEPHAVFNAFEACLEFTHGGKTRYYGGGVAGQYFKSPQEVIGVFWGLVWTSVVPITETFALTRVDEIVHVYKK